MQREVASRRAIRAIFVFACSSILLIGNSAADNKVRLSVQDTDAFAGGTATVSVTMDAGTRPSAIGFWLEYDNTKLTFVNALAGAVVTLAGKDVSWDFPAPGRVSFLIFGLNATRITSGTILSITFDVDDSAQPDDEYEIHGLNASAADPDANSITTEIEDGEIKIWDCFTPSAPANLVATDGIFGDHVQLTWTPVFGAQSYTVLRSTTNNSATASVLAVTLLPFYSDTTAQGASYVSTGSGGCSGGSSQSLRYTEYYYWVRAQNICGQSPLTAADAGWRGKSGASVKSLTAVDALPAVADETTSQIALHLVGDSVIQTNTIGAQVVEGKRTVTSVAWQRSDESGFSGWVIATLDAPLEMGESVTVRADGVTATGHAAGPVSHTFVCDETVQVEPAPGVSAKSGETFALSEWTSAAMPDFIESMGPRYCLDPALPFDGPKHVRIPVPDGVEPNEVLPHLYVAGEGWYPGLLVDGWIVPGSIAVAEQGGAAYVEFDANFGGIVQLGYAASQPAPAGPYPLTGGIPTALAAIVLGAIALLYRPKRQR